MPEGEASSGKLRQHDSAAIHVEGENCQRWAGRRRFAGVERRGKKIGAGRAVALIRRSCSSFESLSGSGWAGWQAGRVPERVTAALPRMPKREAYSVPTANKRVLGNLERGLRVVSGVLEGGSRNSRDASSGQPDKRQEYQMRMVSPTKTNRPELLAMR